MADKGKVFRGQEFMADVEYSIFEWQSGAFKEAQLRINPPIEVSVDRLTLLMSDGRKWNFYSVGDGVCRVTGDPY